jgi:protein TonB
VLIFQSIALQYGASRGFPGLWPALAASTALHLFLLWPAPLLRLPQHPPRPLAATLRTTEASRPARVEPQDVPSPRQEAGKPRPPMMAKPARLPEAAVVAAPLAGGLAATPEGSAAPPAPPGALAAPPSSASASGALDAAEPKAEGLDADGIRAYRVGLAREARAHKRYPQLARERGWAGTAEVVLDISREGLPRQVHLRRSSGYELLDQAALDMLARAAAATPVPESLRRRPFEVRVPVIFDLAEAR